MLNCSYDVDCRENVWQILLPINRYEGMHMNVGELFVD